MDIFHSNGLSNSVIMDNTVLLAKVNRNPHIMAHLIGKNPCPGGKTQSELFSDCPPSMI